MAALRGKWFRERRTCSYLGYVLTMLVMGLWHGLTTAYLVYGAYHGLLMCANDILDTRCKKFKALKKDPRAGAAFDAAFVQLRTADLLRKTVLGGN